jgi:hypothetical protein
MIKTTRVKKVTNFFIVFVILIVCSTFENFAVKYQIFKFPSKSPVAKCLVSTFEAPKVPHLNALGFSD